ncbi:RNA-directed DNA polymerase from mobile element jockey [Trichonephila clavipes]|nr:RNA-directed DNA polymerase from mobile element jockey [Trichonephila clavipes]
MVRKKHKPIPEQRRPKKTPSTRRNSSDSAASEEPPEVTEMDIPLPASPQASRPGTPEKAGPTQLHCNKLQGLAYLIEVLSVSMETSQTILQDVVSKGLTDPTNPIIQIESAALEKNNARLQCVVSEYTSLHPCGIPNCSRHDIQNTPLKPNTRDPTTPIQIKRKEDTEGFTSPPSRKLTKNAHSNSNPESNFKINLNNAFSALDITATDEPIETQVLTNKSPVTTPSKTNPTQPPKLPPPIMLLITDDFRLHTKTLTNKMPALRIKTAGKYVKLYTDTQPQHDTLKQLLTELKYPFYSFTPKHERPIKVVIKGLPEQRKRQKYRYVSITVEGFESRGVIQCFQCNQFNHTAEHCNLTPKCLKCGDKHQTRDCQIKKLDTPFCVNCQVHGHMANYSKCPLFPKPRKGANINSNPILTHNFIRPNISYAQVTQKTNQSDTTHQMAPLVTAPIDTPTIKEIPTPTIVPTQIPNAQTDSLRRSSKQFMHSQHSYNT